METADAQVPGIGTKGTDNEALEGDGGSKQIALWTLP